MCLTVVDTLNTGLHHSRVCLCFTVKIFDLFKQIIISNILYCNFFTQLVELQIHLLIQA